MILLSFLALFALSESAPPPLRGQYPGYFDTPHEPLRGFYGQPNFYGTPQLPREDIGLFDIGFRPLDFDRRQPFWEFLNKPLTGEQDIPKILYPMYFPYLGNLTAIKDYINKVGLFPEGGHVEKVGETPTEKVGETGGIQTKIKLIGYPFYSHFTGYNAVVEIIDDSIPATPIEPVHPEKEIVSVAHPAEGTAKVEVVV